MTRTWTLLVLAALAGSVLPLGTARAQSDAEFQAMRKRMAQLEAEVRELRTTAVETAAYLDEAAAAQSAAAAAPAAGCSNGCCSSGGCGQGCCGGQGCGGQGCCGECGGACGGGCGDYCCGACPPPCVPLFGFEYLQLRPYAAEDVISNNNAQLDFEPAYRVWLGWQLDSGLGARARYFEIDRGEDFNGGSVGVEFRAADVEIIQSTRFGRWDLLISGGARYGETGLRNNNVDTGFNGTGFTTSLTATRDLTSGGGLRLATSARWSILYGNSTQFLNGIANDIDRDDLMGMLELSLGPQMRFTLANGMTVFSGGGVEGQLYQDVAADEGNAGLFGFSTNFGITR